MKDMGGGAVKCVNSESSSVLLSSSSLLLFYQGRSHKHKLGSLKMSEGGCSTFLSAGTTCRKSYLFEAFAAVRRFTCTPKA